MIDPETKVREESRECAEISFCFAHHGGEACGVALRTRRAESVSELVRRRPHRTVEYASYLLYAIPVEYKSLLTKNPSQRIPGIGALGSWCKEHKDGDGRGRTGTMVVGASASDAKRSI